MDADLLVFPGELDHGGNPIGDGCNHPEIRTECEINLLLFGHGEVPHQYRELVVDVVPGDAGEET